MYKLNLDLSELNKTPMQKQADAYPAWKDPVGCWDVSTEGDEEGRGPSTQFGCFRGHIAEIAFHLADRCFYSLQFRVPTARAGIKEGMVFKASKSHVNISFSDGPFRGDLIKGREKSLADFLNAEGIIVTPCNYYGAATLVLKK